MRKGFTIEVFPPKEHSKVNSTLSRLIEFKEFGAEFISVTYRQGGEEFTGKVADYVQREVNSKGIAHLTCAGMSKENIATELNYLQSHNVTGILALRGDLAEDRQTSDFHYATDLMQFINDYNFGFDLYAACYPEGHPESKNIDEDIIVMKKKAELGCKGFATQLFYDNDNYLRFVEKVRKYGVFTPIFAGIMPVTSIASMTRMAELSGCVYPKEILAFAEKYKNSKEDMYKAGIDYSVRQIRELVREGTESIHLYSMNNPDITRDILRGIDDLFPNI